MTRRTIITGIAASLAAALAAGHAAAQDACAEGRTLEPGVLTVATGNPAYAPWVLNDAPEAGEGFEAAVAYAVAGAMGFPADRVAWVRASFSLRRAWLLSPRSCAY